MVLVLTSSAGTTITYIDSQVKHNFNGLRAERNCFNHSNIKRMVRTIPIFTVIVQCLQYMSSKKLNDIFGLTLVDVCIFTLSRAPLFHDDD